MAKKNGNMTGAEAARRVIKKYPGLNAKEQVAKAKEDFGVNITEQTIYGNRSKVKGGRTTTAKRTTVKRRKAKHRTTGAPGPAAFLRSAEQYVERIVETRQFATEAGREEIDETLDWIDQMGGTDAVRELLTEVDHFEKLASSS